MNKNKYGNIIKKIENIRGKNNINWMNILRLAFELDPKEREKSCQRLIMMIKKFQNY